MAFDSRKYKEEAEKKRSPKKQEPSMAKMISLAILASFAPTRGLLRLHRRKIIDHAIIEPPVPAQANQEQIPILYFHGFRGGDYTTNVMVHQAVSDKHKSGFLKVVIDLLGNIELSGHWTNDAQPIVQVVFRDRIVGIYGIDYYLSMVLPFLAKKFNFKHYDAVAHSLTCPCIIRTEMRYAANNRYPHLHKCALIAGPFNGVTYLGDIPNVNGLTEKGRPRLVNPHYLYLMFRKKRFNPDIQVLNIYGNILDNTNTDRFISVISAKSIRYILAPSCRSYHEIEIRGEEAEHSWMHDNPFVINIIDKFLGLK